MSDPIVYPVSFAAYWGSDPDTQDTATALSFADAPSHGAFMHGVNEAEGSFEANFVGNGAYYANKDGAFVERRGANTASSDKERYVIWGEKPETGARAQTYAFETVQEAEAFQQGVEEATGWTNHFFVPDASFKPYPGLGEALAALPAVGRAALAFYMEREDIDEGHCDPVFVRADGAFVEEGWLAGASVNNVPLDQAQWSDRFDAALRSGFATSIVDAGLDTSDLARMASGPISRFPEDAAQAFADKHDLTPVPQPRTPKA